MPLISFDTPWKHQKTGFLMFLGGIKKFSGKKLVNSANEHTSLLFAAIHWFQLNKALLYHTILNKTGIIRATTMKVVLSLKIILLEYSYMPLKLDFVLGILHIWFSLAMYKFYLCKICRKYGKEIIIWF